MTRRRAFSAQALSVLAALCADPADWKHGYGIAVGTGLKSGTLYPILIRLADRGMVETRWEDEQPAGRPRRHLYRLTCDGLEAARAALAESAQAGAWPAGAPRAAPGARRRLASRGAIGQAVP